MLLIALLHIGIIIDGALSVVEAKLKAADISSHTCIEKPYARYSNTQNKGVQGVWEGSFLLFSEERNALKQVDSSYKLVAGSEVNTESLIYARNDMVLLDRGVLNKYNANWHQGVWALVWDPKEEHSVWVIAVHTDSPAGVVRDANRRFFYEQLPEELVKIERQIQSTLKDKGYADKKQRSLMMGDFNGTYHSLEFKKMVDRLTAIGWMWRPTAATWPTISSKWGLGWGIDHAFVKGISNWSVKAVEPKDSDHMQVQINICK